MRISRNHIPLREVIIILIDNHNVVRCVKPREGVGATVISHVGSNKSINGQIENPVTIVIAIERYRCVRNSLINGILRLVSVPVIEQRIPDDIRSTLIITEVSPRGSATDQRYRHLIDGGRRRVIRLGPVASRHVTSSGHSQNRIRSIGNTGPRKLKESVGIGCRRRDKGSVGSRSFIQPNRNPRKPGLVVIGRWRSTNIDIIPNSAVDHAVDLIPEISRQVRVTAISGIVNKCMVCLVVGGVCAVIFVVGVGTTTAWQCRR